MTQKPRQENVYLLCDQDHVISVHASAEGAEAARAAAVAKANLELAEPGLVHLVTTQVAVIEHRLLP